MNADQFHDWLVSQGACGDPLAWTQGKTLAETWDTLDSYDWMLWLMRRATNLTTPPLKSLIEEIAVDRLKESINRHAETTKSITSLVGIVHLAALQFKGEGVCDTIRKHIPALELKE